MRFSSSPWSGRLSRLTSRGRSFITGCLGLHQIMGHSLATGHTYLESRGLHQTPTELMRQSEPLVQLVLARVLYRPGPTGRTGGHLSRRSRLHCILFINERVGMDYLRYNGEG